MESRNIYYFPRRRKQKKRRSSEGDDEDQYKTEKKRKLEKKEKKVHFTDDDNNEEKTTRKSKELSNMFEGLSFYLHPSGIDEDKIKSYKRHIIAHDGDVEATYSDIITHVVVQDTCDHTELKAFLGGDSECVVVTTEWLDKCLVKKHLVPTKDFVFTISGT